MKRRLLVLFGSFLLLVLIFTIYSVSTEWSQPRPPESSASPPPSRRRPIRPGQTDIGEGDIPVIIDRDNWGRLRAVYWARRWDKQTETVYKLDRPTVQYYGKGGQVAYVWADSGWAHVEEAAGKINLRKGGLTGNVRIYLDQQPSEPRATELSTDDLDYPDKLLASIEPRRDELLRIYTDRLEFDNDNLLIQTDQQVTLFSPQMDLYGRGLLIEWNAAPRELRLLRIEQGEMMILKQLPVGEGSIALAPAQKRPPAATGPAAAATAASTAAATSPLTGPSPAAMPVAEPVEALPANVYRLRFLARERLINVDWGESRIHGAEELALQFEWDRRWRDLNDRRPPAANRRLAAKPEPPTDQGGATEQAASSNAGRPATTQPSPETSPTTSRQPMYITWSGPLLIEPVGHTDTPSRDKYQLTARGRELQLASPNGTARCRELFYDHTVKNEVRLSGTSASPVQLDLGEENTVLCEVLRFDRADGWVYFDGPGAIRGSGELTRGLQPATRPADTDQPRNATITWKKRAKAKLLEQLDAKSRKPRRILREAEFFGDVEFLAARGEESLTCQHLRVELGYDEEKGRHFPKSAVASWKVDARRTDGRITADRVTVTFGENGDPVQMDADGEVVATYKNEDENAPPMKAFAKHLKSDLVNKVHYLTGREKPAKITRGPREAIYAPRIELYEKSQTVRAKGEGYLTFETARGLSGPLPRPEIATATWNKNMIFDYERGVANLADRVKLQVGENLDRLECAEGLRLMFTKPLGQATTPPGPEKPAGENPGAAPISLARLGKGGLELSMLIANGEVEVESPMLDEAGNVDRRMLLTARRELVYDAQLGRIDVFGAGDFTAEDLRPPGKNGNVEPRATGEIPQQLDRPSQTIFAWKELMSFTSADGNVVLRGQVFMNHRSGRNVLGAEELQKQLGPLPKGRFTRLKCDLLTAEFPTGGAKERSAPTRPGLQEGLQLGHLDRFTAQGNVAVWDGVEEMVEIRCQMLVYDRKKANIFHLFGSMPGQPARPAILSRKLPASGAAAPVSAEEIIYYLDTGRAVIVKPFGSGSQ